MGYPEKLLSDDETIVEHLHPHWITLVPATLWFLLICAVSGVGIAFLPDGSAHNVLLIIILAIAFILVCWLTFGPWLRWRTTHYVITTHRVLIRRGILHHVGRDISLQRISDVAFVRTIWDRMVNAGTLTIESAGEHGQEDLHNVPHSDDIQQLINQLIEKDSDRRAREASGNYQQPMPTQQMPPGMVPPQH
jgi:uncharacterized membrane protein YdbT with pleckstrin-like domain